MKLENPTVYSCLSPGMAISGGDSDKERRDLSPMSIGSRWGGGFQPLWFIFFFYSKSTPPHLKGQRDAVQKKRKNQLLLFFWSFINSSALCLQLLWVGAKKWVLHLGKMLGGRDGMREKWACDPS